MLWKKVYATYCERWPGSDAEALDAAVMQMRMARILHRDDYDRSNGRIRLWHPENPVWLDL